MPPPAETTNAEFNAPGSASATVNSIASLYAAMRTPSSSNFNAFLGAVSSLNACA